jgi:hypothetical protein
VILNDTDHLWGIGGNSAWVWKSFLRGLNPLFMDPYDGAVLSPGGSKWEAVRRELGYTFQVARKVNLAAMTPHNDLATSGYCLAGTGQGAELLVYLPGGGEVTVDLTANPGPLETRWLNPADGTWQNVPSTRGGRQVRLQSPHAKEAVLWLRSPEGMASANRLAGLALPVERVDTSETSTTAVPELRPYQKSTHQ